MKPTLPIVNINTAKQWLQTLSKTRLPRNDFDVSFSRASGPGGQKVNKTSSKSTIALRSLAESPWIPQEIKQQLIEKKFRYLTKSGDIVISSDGTRSQKENLELCFEKFVNEVRQAVWFAGEVSGDDLKKWETIKKNTNETRLKDKKFKSEKKQRKKVVYY